MRRTHLAAVALLVAGVFIAAAGHARPPFHGPGHHGPGGFVERHAEQLGLDAAQQEAIEEIVAESHEDAGALHEERRTLRSELHELLTQEPPDVEAVMAQADAIGAVDVALHKHRLGTMIAIRNQLTPKQRELLTELRGSLREFAGKGLEEDCAADLERLCPDAGDMLGRAHCLRENRDALSPECGEALQCMRRRHMRRGGWRYRHGGGGPGLFGAPDAPDRFRDPDTSDL
jgi:Spy/CpxP family protein refolding chaperone